MPHSTSDEDGGPFRTRGKAVDPASRLIKRRRAVRVLLRAADRVLLLQDTDPGLDGVAWWTTPGGGVEDGEQDTQAAIRELWEETGRLVSEDSVLGPLARRVVRHGYSDQITVQIEAFYTVEVEAPFSVSTTGHTIGEQITLTGHRWWPIDDLRTTAETIWPENLTDLLALPTAGAPVALPDVEESTVPIGHNQSACGATDAPKRVD